MPNNKVSKLVNVTYDAMCSIAKSMRIKCIDVIIFHREKFLMKEVLNRGHVGLCTFCKTLKVTIVSIQVYNCYLGMWCYHGTCVACLLSNKMF